MKDKEYGEFIVKVVNTLEKNGFPNKKVSLPLDQMYRIAYEKGLNFNKVLEFLEAKDIAHTKTNEKIIFEPKSEGEQPQPEFPGAEDPSALFQKAQELMRNMSPEQMEQIGKMYSGLSDQQKQELMNKAKDMGLF